MEKMTFGKLINDKLPKANDEFISLMKKYEKTIPMSNITIIDSKSRTVKDQELLMKNKSIDYRHIKYIS